MVVGRKKAKTTIFTSMMCIVYFVAFFTLHSVAVVVADFFLSLLSSVYFQPNVFSTCAM